MNRVQTLAVGSIVVGIVVLGPKYFAYHLTGSVALLSDAIESIVNVVTAVVAVVVLPSAPDSSRGAVLALVENGQWIVTLSGNHGDAPPGDYGGVYCIRKNHRWREDIQFTKRSRPSPRHQRRAVCSGDYRPGPKAKCNGG
jgi:hypothetical protein